MDKSLISHHCLILTPIRKHKAALSKMHWPKGRFVIKTHHNPLYPLQMINIEVSPQVFGLLRNCVYSCYFSSQLDVTVSLKTNNPGTAVLFGGRA